MRTKNILQKLNKIGIISLGMLILINNKSFAVRLDTNLEPLECATLPIPVSVEICKFVYPIIQIILAVIFIATGLSIFRTKIKTKEKFELKKVKKWIRITFVLSGILFILLSILMNIIISKYY